MLAARKARKASLNEKSAAASAAAAAAKASETAVPAAVAAAAGSKGAAAGGSGAKAQGKWGWGAKFLAGTSAGLAVLGIAWQLKPDEVRRLLDDSPVDHFAIWLMGKYALVRENLGTFLCRLLCECECECDGVAKRKATLPASPECGGRFEIRGVSKT